MNRMLILPDPEVLNFVMEWGILWLPVKDGECMVELVGRLFPLQFPG